MAEFVHQNLEETLLELEQLERVGLFTKVEIKTIVKKRTGFEYRLVRLRKDKQDFLRYIQYEVNFLALIKKRRERIGYFFKKDEIEYAIIRRIQKLFRRACTMFCDDQKLWFSHMQFCKKWNMNNELSRLFTRLLKVHSSNPALWIIAAKFQMEEIKSAENARSLLLRAIRHHPKNHKLRVEYFRMELMHADKQRKRWALLQQGNMEAREEGMEDPILKGKVAMVVYKMAIQDIPGDIDLHLAFLSVCKKFDFTQDLEEEIYQDLLEAHPENELMWDAVAKRHLTADSNGSESIHLAEETQCHEVYEKAVKRLPTAKMWSMYINCCIDRLQLRGMEDISDKRAEKTVQVFASASKQSSLPDDLYVKWMHLLQNLGKIDEAKDVAASAIVTHRHSAAVWEACLRLSIQDSGMGKEHQQAEVSQLFDSAISFVKAKHALPLWRLGLEWCLIMNPDNVQEIFKAAIKEPPAVSTPMKIVYLEWVAIKKGISKARKIYKRLSRERPLSVDFFKQYITIEQAQPEPNMARIRRGYEDALAEFGSSRPDLWLDFIRLEKDSMQAAQLHWRAMKALSGPGLEDFTNGYTLLQTGHVS
ncbi:U3 small nucleolar RNA-associated protein 6 homolog isoform X2 [Acanthaster planci]|uniref:U3 small nucleolar RNA-associated protein 6 homolog isoform X1 n=1 Tax=Acanthaster planci TaxID=133434 RepID=A0A8B7YAF4_ACAPL|nr:U3 small nucleolar RNA-associated protein 6 homolog isoform X1 [Acanthaster planci]XP_022089356.1 U3 small nucleolar RNA-associated protein 6 homolog isoform X2 [Acanthaster planci]